MVATKRIGPNSAVMTKAQVERKLDDRINALRKGFAKTQEEIQSLIIDISKHCIGLGSGDITRAARLVDALPRWARRADVISYWARFSPVNIMKDKDGAMKASLRSKSSDMYVEWNIPWAEVPENSFFAVIAAMKEPGFYTFEDAEMDVIKLAERHEKRLANKAKIVPDNMPAEQALALLSDDEKSKGFVVVREAEANNIRKLVMGLKKFHNDNKPKAAVQQLKAENEEKEEHRESAAA